MSARRPLIGIVCCNEIAERPIQAVATRFIDPVARYTGGMPLLVPALPDALNASQLADTFDGLLLTGSRSDVAPRRYGSGCDRQRILDEGRDEVALRLAGRMIDRGRPVFGICRGLQELNVLYGGTLTCGLGGRHFAEDKDYSEQFDNRHQVRLTGGGQLATGLTNRCIEVTSVHQEGIERLGSGLTVEARAVDDGLVEAFAASGEPVLAVQWHPEWDVGHCADARHFFTLLGEQVRAVA